MPREPEPVIELFGYVLLALGMVIVCFNSCLNLRFIFHRFLKPPYKHISGIPVFRTLFLVCPMDFLTRSVVAYWSALLIALLDTGGLHFFFITMIWHEGVLPGHISVSDYLVFALLTLSLCVAAICMPWSGLCWAQFALFAGFSAFVGVFVRHDRSPWVQL